MKKSVAITAVLALHIGVISMPYGHGEKSVYLIEHFIDRKSVV